MAAAIARIGSLRLNASMSEEIAALMLHFPVAGRLEWIGIRPGYRCAVEPLSHVQALADFGLAGDHAAQSRAGKRQVTLIQSEHLSVIAQVIGRHNLEPAELRRNLVISGINLLALRRCVFSIGDVVLAGTGVCAPCSRMEAVLGAGGYNAMRGHGGITARVVEGGAMRLGDAVRFLRLQD
jgi:MOSC domain-containing protein YiiM